jgi:hypothetical protein
LLCPTHAPTRASTRWSNANKSSLFYPPKRWQMRLSWGAPKAISLFAWLRM